MAGISSKAFGGVENKYRYNGIELDTSLGIDEYDAQLRNLDPQTGRWWQVDPETEDQEMWSPYTSNYDNPILYKDPRGNEGEACCGGLWDAVKKFVGEVKALALGVANAWGSDQVLGAGNRNAEEAGFTGDEATLYNAGQTTGHGVAIITGAVEWATGAGSEVLTVGGSTPVSVPLTLHGASSVATAFSKLLTQGASTNGNSKQSENPQHNYDVKNTENGNAVKMGTSGGKETKTGQSYRGNSQANKWNKQEGSPGKYKSETTNRVKPGPGARQKALDYETKRADKVRDQLDPTKHKRP